MGAASTQIEFLNIQQKYGGDRRENLIPSAGEHHIARIMYRQVTYPVYHPGPYVQLVRPSNYAEGIANLVTGTHK